MMRAVIAIVATLFATSPACAQTLPATARATTRPAILTFRGCVLLPAQAHDQNGRPFDIHGVSGITCASRNTYWAVLDNSDKLVRLGIKLNTDGSIESADVTAALTIAGRADHEGIAYFAA